MTNHHSEGFARPGRPRAVGTALKHSAGGVRAVRQHIHHLPALTAALGWLISEVVQEGRQDLATSTSKLHMASDGSLSHRRTSAGYWFTVRALDQLMKLLDTPPHAGPYLAAIPTDRRAGKVPGVRDMDRPTDGPEEEKRSSGSDVGRGGGDQGAEGRGAYRQRYAAAVRRLRGAVDAGSR